MANTAKKAYLNEDEFNKDVLSKPEPDPTQDSPDDSDKLKEEEVEMGLDTVSEDEPDEVEGLTDPRDREIKDYGPQAQQVEHSPTPGPEEDENSPTSTH